MSVLNPSPSFLFPLHDIYIYSLNIFQETKAMRWLQFISFFSMIILLSCESKYSSYYIHNVPEIDKEFYETALSAINESIEDYPKNVDNYYKKALLLEKMGKYPEATAEITNAIEIGGSQWQYQLLLAELLARDKQYTEAIEAALKANKPDINRIRYNAVLAELYLKANNKVKAFDHINKAIILAPARNDLYYKKGLIYLAYRDTVNAEKSILLSINDSVENNSAYQMLTDIYIEKKQYQQAKKYLSYNLEQEPDYPEYLYQQALILRSTDQSDSAKTILQQLLAKNPANHAALGELGFVFYERYKYDSANFYASKALTAKNDYKKAMLLQARVLDRRRQYWEALQKYAEIVAMDSNYNIAVVELEKLKGKIAYLQRMERQRQEREEIKPIAPIENQ